MPVVITSAGPIHYADTGGPGPVVFLVGGLAMDHSIWDEVVERLRPTYRCVAMTQPLGSHPEPLHPGADLTLTGLARIQAEVLAGLDLHDVTLVGNDSGAFLATATAAQDRIARLVITSCEAFGHFPPGLPGRGLATSARFPGGITLTAQALRLPWLRRTPAAFGWMARRPLPRALTDRWLAPLLTDAGVRRDLRSYLRTSRRAELVAATAALARFGRPTRILWTPDDKVMRPEHGRRLADLIPGARLIEVPGSRTLLPWDRPDVVAAEVAAFVGAHDA